MTLTEIKAVVESGKTVYAGSPGYIVLKDNLGQWLIKYRGSDYCIGLTHRDGVTLNGRPEDFWIAEGIEDNLFQRKGMSNDRHSLYRILKVKPDYLTVILNDGMVPSKPARITRQEFIDYFTKIA